MKKKAIIFDMDGVLFDTERLYLEVWTEIFNEYGYEFLKEDYFMVMGKGRKKVKEIFKDRFGSMLPVEEMYNEKDIKLLKRIYEDKHMLKNGAIEILTYLKENNYKIGLATSAKKDRVLKQLKDFDLNRFFDAVVTGDEITKGKPNPDIFLKAVDKLKVTTKDAIVLEDSKAGIKAALAANIECFHVKDLIENYDLPVLSFDSLFDVINYLGFVLINC